MQYMYYAIKYKMYNLYKNKKTNSVTDANTYVDKLFMAHIHI